MSNVPYDFFFIYTRIIITMGMSRVLVIFISFLLFLTTVLLYPNQPIQLRVCVGMQCIFLIFYDITEHCAGNRRNAPSSVTHRAASLPRSARDFNSTAARLHLIMAHNRDEKDFGPY